MYLLQDLRRIVNVLEHIQRDDGVERTGQKRQLFRARANQPAGDSHFSEPLL